MKYTMLIASAVCLFSTNIMAMQSLETRPHTLNLTLGGGEVFFPSKRQLDNTGVLLGGIGFSFCPTWSVEALYAGFDTRYKLGTGTHKDQRGHYFLFDGIYHFASQYSLEPYVLAGVGVTSLDSNPRKDANNEGNINAGIGAHYFIHPQISFRLEARDIYTLVGGKNDVMLDAGITLHFDLC